MGTIIGFLVVLILTHGVSVCLRHSARLTYFRNAHEVMGKVKQFMDENTPPTTPVATPEWGIVPFILGRTCYKTLTDESHLLTLERMAKYKTEYLVIVSLSWATSYSQEMVEEMPQLFRLILEVEPEGEGPVAALYSVDLKGVQAFLNDALKQRKAVKNRY